MTDLKSKHPKFHGNWGDLQNFERLAATPVRKEGRDEALRAWASYKLERQYAVGGGRRKKGNHIGTLISRVVDLTGANLDEICIGYADLRGVIFDECSLRSAWLKGANFENASLRSADFSAAPNSTRGPGRLLYAYMHGADFTGANCRGVDFSFASLNDATLVRADLSDADLGHVSLVRSNVEGAILRNTRVYGISAWDLEGVPAIQQDLIISQKKGPGIKSYYEGWQTSSGRESERSLPTVDNGVKLDNLELAQFVNLLMHNEKIRDVIDTVGQRGVLILGRFTKERKLVLEAIRTKLRELGFVPMLFDFEGPTQRNITETIRTLASLSCFIVADITNPKSSPLELQAVMPNLMVPVATIIQEDEEPFSMFRDLWQMYDWVLSPRKYGSVDHVVEKLDAAVVRPAMQKSRELRTRRAQEMPVERM
jgi:Pentapeptide repeats (8 copies)